MEINNPQVFDHILELGGQVLQPQLVGRASTDLLTFQSGVITWRTQVAAEYFGPPVIIEANGAAMFVKVIEIGPWNMDIVNAVAVAHGLDYTKIRYAHAMIIEDIVGEIYPLDRCETVLDPTNSGYIMSWSGTNINLYRFTGGYFDTDYFDDGVMNRGFITIWYQD